MLPQGLKRELSLLSLQVAGGRDCGLRGPGDRAAESLAGCGGHRACMGNDLPPQTLSLNGVGDRGQGSPGILFSSCPFSSSPVHPTPPALLHSAFASPAVSSEAQTIAADDPSAESTAAPPPQPEIRFRIAGARLPGSGLSPPSHFLLEMSPCPPRTPPHPSRASLGEVQELVSGFAPLLATPARWGVGWGAGWGVGVGGLAPAAPAGPAVRGACGPAQRPCAGGSRGVTEPTPCSPRWRGDKPGSRFPWKRHLFAAEPESEPGPCAWGCGGGHGGQGHRSAGWDSPRAASEGAAHLQP